MVTEYLFARVQNATGKYEHLPQQHLWDEPNFAFVRCIAISALETRPACESVTLHQLPHEHIRPNTIMNHEFSFFMNNEFNKTKTTRKQHVKFLPLQ
jgi:hypothetical protein